MSEKDLWKFRIGHILRAIEEIESFVRGMDYARFVGDVKTVRAVERNIEIIGEAASKIPAEVIARYSEIPWGGMKGMRNAIIHGYEQVEYESVWDVVKDRLPALKKKLEAIQADKE